MSRIGKKPVQIPAGVKVQIADRTISVEGPLGKLQWEFRPEVSVAYDEGAKVVVVSRQDDERLSRALHGLTRALIANMIVGVTQGYEKRLEIQGVGYLAALHGKILQLRVGLANELQVPIPEGLKITVPDQQHIVIQGIEKQKVGHFAAAVRALRKPELYKGKGIRFLGEAVRRKQGKAMAK
jgi:large subunit ribosomal protein L6